MSEPNEAWRALNESIDREDRERARVAGEEVQAFLQKEGVETRIREVPENTTFRTIILFPDHTKSNEPLVRVYRGIRQLDATVLNQVPYALRSWQNDESITILEHARPQVEALANEPTYENLLAYIEAVWPDLTDKEVEGLSNELRDIEDSVLSGIPLRRNILHTTYAHGMGYMEAGIAPYISASTHLEDAAGYGRAGVMVLDVPVAKLEAMGVDGKGEVSLKGALPVEYITAILPRTKSRIRTEKKDSQEIEGACRTIDSMITHRVMTEEEIDSTYRTLRVKEAVEDAKLHEQNVAAIQERRAKLLREKYPDLHPSHEAIAKIAQEEETDIYTATRRALYDQLTARYESAGGERETLERYTFASHFNFQTKVEEKIHYTRSKVSDEMLKKLRDIVIRQEKHMEARGAY